MTSSPDLPGFQPPDASLAADGPRAAHLPAVTAELASRLGAAARAVAWWLLNAAQAVFLVVWSVGWISLALLVAAVARRPTVPLALARRAWAPGLLRIAGVRLEVEGRERVDFRQPHLFAANHLSWIDVPSLFSALPTPLLFLGKRQLARVPFLGWYMAATGMVFIDRGRGTGAARGVAQAAARLRAGRSVLTFPEGTRERGRGLQPFKSAGFSAAIETGVPVVPVALEGSDRVLPAGGFRARPGVIRVRLGEPIPTAGLARDDRDDRAALARRVEERVRELLGPAAAPRRSDETARQSSGFAE